MKREISVTIFVSLLLVCIYCIPARGQPQHIDFAIRMSTTFSNEEEIGNWAFTKEEKAVNIFMNSSRQTVQVQNYSWPIETFEPDDDGNPLAILQFPKSELSPGENISYTVTYHAISKPSQLPTISEEQSGTLANITADLKDEYCQAEKNWLTSDLGLQELARSIKGDETRVLTVVKNFVAWISNSNNIGYVTHDVPLYANETLLEGGDCDDQAILLITLCRICNIPAYLQIGCIYLPTKASSTEKYWNDHVVMDSKQIGWHGWAMVYIPPWGWLPVDLTYVVAPGGLADPLNAIRGAAVTTQSVVQYMNVSKTDYINSSRSYRDFLEQNAFYIYEQHEMISLNPINLWESVWRLLPLILVTAVVSIVSVTIIVYVTTKRRHAD